MKSNFLFYFLLFDFETQKTLNTWIWFWQANPVLTNNFQPLDLSVGKTQNHKLLIVAV